MNSDMNSDKARERAEKSFKKEERAQDGRKAMIEYEAEARATHEKTARLKALRLAKEAQARNEPPPPKLAERRPTRRCHSQRSALTSERGYAACGSSGSTAPRE